MKKILILAYDFPPYVSVGGLRPYSWYKYLHEFDVYPIVITRQWNNKYGNHLDYIAPSDSNKTIIEKSEQGTIIKTPYQPNFPNRLMLKYGENKYRLIRKLFSAYYEFAQYLIKSGPKSQIYIAAEEFLQKNKVDFIIASGDPFIIFKYASKLSDKFNTPWIADYRDPWSQTSRVQKNIFLRYWTTYFEKKIVKNSYAITTVLDVFKFKIQKSFINKKIYIIPNGYDPEAIEKINGIKQQDQILSIAFIGTIEKYHPVRIFLSAVSGFIKKRRDAALNINFYGINREEEIKEMLLSDFPELIEHIHIFLKMPNDILLKELAKNNLMLLFNYYSNIGTKIYDYIAIKRAILFCFANDVESNELKEKFYPLHMRNEPDSHPQEELIKQTNAGYIVQNSEQLIILIEQLYNEFSEKGYIPCNTTDAVQYSRKNQTKILAEIIENIAKE